MPDQGNTDTNPQLQQNMTSGKNPSSPWEDDLPVEEPKKQIVGTLTPSEPVDPGPTTLKVPENIEEKVGAKIPAEQVVAAQPPAVTQKQVAQPAAPVPQPVAQLQKPEQPRVEVQNALPTQQPVPTPQVKQAPEVASPQMAPVKPAKDSFFGGLLKKKSEQKQILKQQTPSIIKPNVQPKNPSSIKGRIAFVFAGILMVLALGILLTEYGLLSIGLEKAYGKVGLERLWGGLPSSTESAIIRSFVSMSSKPDFKMTGKIDYTLDASMNTELGDYIINVASKSSTGPTIPDALASSSVPTAASKPKGLVTHSATVNLQQSISSSKAEITYSGSKITIINKGKDLLVKDNVGQMSSRPTDWSDFQVNSLDGKKFQSEILKVDSAKGFSAKGTRIGTEKINGVRTFKYSLEGMELGNTLSSIGISSDMTQTITGSIWIGIKDKNIQRARLKITTPSSSFIRLIDVDFYFSDFGIKNAIDSISESDVITGSLATRTSTKEDPVLTNDTKRKADVANILAALKQYKTEVGYYPLALEITKISDQTNVITKALVPKYIDQIPTDPKSADGWYYAYKSDGIKCSVSSRLEKSDDKDGTLVNNVLLYLKYNND